MVCKLGGHTGLSGVPIVSVTHVQRSVQHQDQGELEMTSTLCSSCGQYSHDMFWLVTSTVLLNLIDFMHKIFISATKKAKLNLNLS